MINAKSRRLARMYCIRLRRLRQGFEATASRTVVLIILSLYCSIMIIDNVALLIPIHPPHYHFIYNALDKLKSNDIAIDVFLIFSSKSDYDLFTMKEEIHPIILPETYHTKSIVTFKKFYGLRQLADSKYDHLICCDSEIDIIPSNFTDTNINAKIKQIFETKKIYAGKTDDYWANHITRTSADLFPDKQEMLKTLTDDFKLYFWWSDLPVYRRTDITPFLNMINYDSITWYHFDFIIYQYYLLLFHNFEIVNITPITNIHTSLEGLNTSNPDVLNQLLDINYGFGWNTKQFYNLNKVFVESQKGFLIYHLDRY